MVILFDENISKISCRYNNLELITFIPLFFNSFPYYKDLLKASIVLLELSILEYANNFNKPDELLNK